MNFQSTYFSKKMLAEGWHRVRLNRSHHWGIYRDSQHWCEERIEFKDWVYIFSTSDLESEYWFKHEQDAVMFALKWL